MSGHRPYSELTKHFTPEMRQYVETQKAKLRVEMDLLDEMNAKGNDIAADAPDAERMEAKQPSTRK